MSVDRHENKNWRFVKAKPDPILEGRFIRLYQSTSNPDLYKRVAKRAGSSCCNQWDAVTYTLATAKTADGSLVWVRSVAETNEIARRNEEHNFITEYNSATDARRIEMENGVIPEGLRRMFGPREIASSI